MSVRGILTLLECTIRFHIPTIHAAHDRLIGCPPGGQCHNLSPALTQVTPKVDFK